MSYSIGFSFTLLLATVAVSLASDGYESAPVIIVNADSAAQSAPGWWSFLKREDMTKPEQTNNANVTDLFSFMQLTAVPSAHVEGKIRYTLGNRLPSDRLVGHGADSKRWNSPQDVTLTLRYPNSGQGAMVTYVEILVDQSSNIGQAQVVAGGIGQHAISIAVFAKSTVWFTYSADIYGI